MKSNETTTPRTHSLIPALAALSLAAAASLAGCGGGSGSSGPGQGASPSTFALSASVTGLAAAGLVLTVNGSSVPVASGATTVPLASGLTANTSYSVTVATQPSGESCAVANGTGTITDADVSDVQVTCQTVYSLSATFAHLHADGLALSVNGSTVSVATGTTSLVLASNLTAGTAYTVSIGSQPTGQNCSVANGTGTISSSNVSNVTVSCPFTLLYDFDLTGWQPTGSLLAGNGVLYGLAGSGNLCCGLIFQYDLGTGTESSLWQFTGPPAGFPPTGTLSLDFQGNLEGVTDGGGATNAGTVFEFNPINHTETDLASFSTVSTGNDAVGGVGDYNNVYGACVIAPPYEPGLGLTGGGGTGAGTGAIYQLTGSDTLVEKYGFQGRAGVAGQSDGAQPVGRLAYDCADDMFYGLTHSGGAGGYGTIFQFDPSTNTETVLYSFGNGSDGEAPDGSLIVASDGNLYGMTATGGIYKEGVIFEFDLQKDALDIVYSFAGGQTDGSAPEGSLLQASDGEFYGMTTAGGANGLGTLFRLDPSTGTETVLYSFGTAVGDTGTPEGHLIDDGNGDLYGLTTQGIFEYQTN